MDLLRLTTAGSVDDGKSTLIGRLLFDSKSIFEDQLRAVEEASRRRGEGSVNLALLTDGLRAEREQNITIDVAYRYFATPRRRFIIADTPGHIQYTRNMVTGASTAELAVILVDARKGVVTQSKRHGFIASLLGIPHLLVAVNKMDLVGWSEDAYAAVREEYTAFAARLGAVNLTFIPLSALHGDNVVERSDHLRWYRGPTLLHHLEHVNVGANRNLVDFRFPVQYVIRADGAYRGYAGRVASGAITPGEEVLVLPSGRHTRVRSIDTLEGPLESATLGDSVVLRVEDDLDIARGDMIVRPLNLPHVGTELDAVVCWTAETPFQLGYAYWVRQTTREVRGFGSRLVYRINPDTLHRENAGLLELNEIGRVQLSTAQPLFFDPYTLNRETGGFILVDPHTHATMAVGVVRGPVRRAEDLPKESAGNRTTSQDVVWDRPNVAREEHESRTGHRAAVIWLTGLPASGKTTLARALERRFFAAGCRTMLLDGDMVRHGLCGDLGFTPEDRRENIRRIGEVAGLFYRQGSLVVCAFVSPFRDDRLRARAVVPEGAFVEVFVDTPVEECERRDPKGLYARARRGEIAHMTGVSSPYQPPGDPEIHVRTTGVDVDEAVDEVLDFLRGRGILPEAAEPESSERA